MSRYVIVTPVRDEAAYIAETVQSVLAQTKLPTRWVIVDDGSTDRTPQILAECTRNVPWITVLQTGSRRRDPGCGEIVAFQHGLAEIGADTPFDFLVKLDGDLRLPPRYFEQLLERMAADPRWGIASGIYCEETDGRWVPVKMPDYHAAGASKVIRAACYDAIGGFVAHKGWDTVDEVRAGLQGWRTGHFADIAFRHLKPEGAAMGGLRTHRFHGEIYYQTGGGLVFLLAKSLHHMFRADPPVMGGLAMLWGYLWPMLTVRPRLVSPTEAGFYRAMLNRRLTAPVMRLFHIVRS